MSKTWTIKGESSWWRACDLHDEGDTFVIDGTVRLTRQVTWNDLKDDVTLEAWGKPAPVITNMRETTADDWEAVDNGKNGTYRYVAEGWEGVDKVTSIPNVSVDGMPLLLANEGQRIREYLHANDIWGWCRNSNEIYVRLPFHPGSRNVEVCWLEQGRDLFALNHDTDSPKGLTFRNLTLEGGFYPLVLDGQNTAIENCTVGNCHGDAVKIEPNAEGIRILGCTLERYGEAGIDCHGSLCDITGNTIQDAANCRIEPKTHGLTLKNGVNHCVVSGNTFRRINCVDSYLIALGMQTTDGPSPSAKNCSILNNRVENCCGRNVYQIRDAEGCWLRGIDTVRCQFDRLEG